MSWVEVGAQFSNIQIKISILVTNTFVRLLS